MKNRLKQLCHLIRQQQGAVLVEFALYLVAFTLLCGVLVDLGTTVNNKSQLERVNNSMAQVLRERNVFYQGREQIDQRDLSQLKALADQLLTESTIGSNTLLVVDAWYFKINKSGNKEKKLANQQTLISSGPSCMIQNSANEESTILALSPWSDYPLVGEATPRWLPVYRLTLCAPGAESWFKRALGAVIGNKQLQALNIRNVVVPR